MAKTQAPRLPYRRRFSLAAALACHASYAEGTTLQDLYAAEQRQWLAYVASNRRPMSPERMAEICRDHLVKVCMKALGYGLTYHFVGLAVRVRHCPRKADLRRIPLTTRICDIPAAYAAIRRA